MKTHALRAFATRPIAVLAVVFTLIMAGNALLAGCGGGSQQSTNQPPPEQTPPPSSTGSASADDVALGNKVYSEKCSVCHGTSGKGDGPGGAALNPKPRDHTDGSYMNAQSDEALLNVIRNGKGNMPAWKDVLSDAEQHAVLKHVRSLAVPAYPGQS